MSEGKSQYIGVILISIILFFLLQNNLKPKTEINSEVTTESVDSLDTKAPVLEEEIPITEIQIDQNDTAALNAKDFALKELYGEFYKNVSGTEEEYVIENDLLRLIVSSKGAQIKEVELKEFKTFDKQALLLVKNTQELNYLFQTKDGKEIQTKDLFFDVNNTVNSVELTANLDNGKSLIVNYSLESGSYLVDYSVDFQGITNSDPIQLEWDYTALKQEQDLSSEETKSTAYWKIHEDDVEHLGIGKSKDEEISDNTDWISYKQRFFNATILNPATFDDLKINTTIDSEDTTEVASYASILTLKVGEQHNFQFFYGPNDYRLLKNFDNGMHHLVELSVDFFLFRWVKWINALLIIPLFHFLEKFFTSYGVIILIMTLIIKMILMPLTFKSYVSTAKTKVLRPELEELKKQYGDDSAGYSKAQMELYQKAGVNMFGGCLPMLLQMPFLLAMFYFFPSSIELRQETFLWATDLSTFDSVPWLTWSKNIFGIGNHISIFTVLMTLSSLLMAKFNPQMQSQPTQKGMEMMKYMPYIFPFFLFFLFNSFPAALTYYYFLSNMITFGQQIVINKFFIDEDKLKAQIEENKKKPIKKSKLAMKMEEVYKQQELQKKNRK